MASKIIHWVDKSLDAVERAAANARAAIKTKEALQERLFLAKSALLCVKYSSPVDSPAFNTAVEALKKLEDV